MTFNTSQAKKTPSLRTGRARCIPNPIRIKYKRNEWWTTKVIIMRASYDPIQPHPSINQSDNHPRPIRWSSHVSLSVRLSRSLSFSLSHVTSTTPSYMRSPPNPGLPLSPRVLYLYRSNNAVGSASRFLHPRHGERQNSPRDPCPSVLLPNADISNYSRAMSSS